MPAMRPGEIVLGDHRLTADGNLEVKASRKWVPYPEDAIDLIALARDNGWGVDNGLPTRHTHDGEVYIRLLIGRERGLNPLTGKASNGVQFHLTWRLRDHTWYTTEGYVNVGNRAWSAWRTIRSREYVRQTITNNPVSLAVEETHADA
jgi:hypothetical protein